MKVNYRIVEEFTPDGKWEAVGVIAYWVDDPPHRQLRGMLQHTVSRFMWRKIRQRAKACQLTLDTYHQALQDDYAAFYRILPEIHHITANSAAEIRQQLRQTYVFGLKPEPLTA